MEEATDIIEAAGQQFTFGLQYYGKVQGTFVGYFVMMINELYDSFISAGGASAEPFYYWVFRVNGQLATSGVTLTVLNKGDDVEFAFEMFEMAKHQGSTAAIKFARQTQAH